MEGHSHTIYDVAFTPENYVLSAAWDGTVRLWDKDEPNAAISVLLP
ncbi:MAG: WD40 repeat domain-containing protein [Chloroflexota bacterium]